MELGSWFPALSPCLLQGVFGPSSPQLTDWFANCQVLNNKNYMNFLFFFFLELFESPGVGFQAFLRNAKSRNAFF